MMVKRSLLVAALLCGSALGPVIVAQDEPATPATPEPAPTPAPEPPTPKSKTPNGLFVGVGYGSASAKDLDLSNSTLSSHTTETTLQLDDNSFAQAAIGWRLNNNRGDFRFVFNGYSEDSFTIDSTGLSGQVVDVSGTQPPFSSNIDWWHLSIKDGMLHSARTPRTWDPATDDTNGNGSVDPGEAQTLPADIVIDRPFASNLENRAQTYDFVYGNTWGPRRFKGRWWAGLRYFAYDGNVPVAAWLATSTPGYGFTDGALFHVLNFSQSTTGGGPTGSMEVQFRFLRERLSLFAMGQAAFVVLSLDIDTGPFFTLAGGNYVGEARLNESISKSSWQNRLQGGVRYRFDSGLELELAYDVTGYLDSVLLPTSIRIPATTQEIRFGTSAIYRTQDIVYHTWHGGVSFQF